jgi:hypothetical protein
VVQVLHCAKMRKWLIYMEILSFLHPAVAAEKLEFCSLIISARFGRGS